MRNTRTAVRESHRKSLSIGRTATNRLCPTIEALEERRLLAVVFQADFSGTGTGTGAGNLVSLGGTGTLLSGTNATGTQATTNPFVNPASGGYLRIVDNGTGSGNAGITLKPSSAATSPDSWYVNGGTSSFDTVNGAFDFLFRTSVGSAGWGEAGTAFRPIDVSGGAGGMRLIINAPGNNALQMELVAYNGSGVKVMDLFAKNTNVSFAANTLYHLGATVRTDGAGKVTIKLFAARGNVDIDTAGSSSLLASATSASAMDLAAANAVTHAFNSSGASGFVFGKILNADTVAQTQEFDSFRVYNAVPPTIGALAYYPDFTDYATPADNPAAPGDPFTPPVNASSPVANSPTIAECTRNGGPGDSLVLTGDKLTSFTGNDLGKDSAFIAYGQSNSALGIGSSTIPALEANKATLTLDSSLPGGSLYFLWARNSVGYSRPVAINKADAWWVGPDVANPGQTISLYGQNLSYHGGTTSAWVYIKPASGAGQWATVTAVNPYKVDFVVPASLTSGTYQIWAHNGTGGKYGWSSPLTLTVTTGYTNAFVWPTDAGHTFDAKAKYGAKGDGTTNDATAIQNAINAAHTANNYSTVYLPAGTYLVNTHLQLYSNMRILGDGQTSTILLGSSADFDGGSDSGVLEVGLYAPTPSNVAVQKMTINASANGANFAIHGRVSNMSISDVDLSQLSSVTINNKPNCSSIYLDQSSYLFLNRINVRGGSVSFNGSRQVFIDHTNFYGKFDQHLLNSHGPVNEFAATNNTGQDYDNTSADGWSSGVWWKFLNNGAGAERGFYFENNTSHDLGVRPNNGTVGQLWGEQYSWEQEYSWFIAGPAHNSNVTASVLSATAISVTFNANVPPPSGSARYMAIVIDGKGIGQSRMITVYNGATITLDRAWNVIPDATSMISVIAAADHIAIYNNHMDGKTADTLLPDTAISNSSAIQPYGGVLNLVADSNDITDTRYGIFTCDLGERSGTINYFEPNYFHLYVNNTIQNTRWAIQQNQSGADFSGAVPATYLLGMVFRRNNITGTVRSAFSQYAIDPGTTARWINMNVMEQSTVTNVPIGVDLTAGHPSQQGNQVFLDNNFSLGSATPSGSIGFKFYSTNQLVELEHNTWSGFQTLYSSGARGQVLAAPIPAINITVPQGSGTVTRPLSIWNEGTASLTWSPGSDSSWLSVSAGGAIAAEGAATATLTVNPATLAAGVYTGTITLTSGSQTEKATVSLTVLPPPPMSASLQVNDGSAQRSMVTGLGLTFDQPVGLAGDGVTLLSRSQPSAATLNMNPSSGYTNLHTFSFSGTGVIGRSLPDGAYMLSINAAAVVDAFGQSPAVDLVFRFHRLFGDVNGDRIVNSRDLKVFKAALNQPANSYAYFDYYGTGTTIDNADYLQLRKRLVKPLL